MIGGKRMKKLITAVLAASLVMGALTACADENSSSKSETRNAASRAAQPAAKQGCEDADFFEFYYTGSAEDFLGKTIDEINAATGDKFTEANASEYDLEYGCAYDLGEVESISDGRIALGGKYPVELVLSFGDDGKLNKILYKINEGAGDSKAVSDALIKSLEDNAPEGYTGEYEPRALGKNSAWFAKDVDGYVFTVRHMDADDSGYPVYFSAETYKDKYGL